MTTLQRFAVTFCMTAVTAMAAQPTTAASQPSDLGKLMNTPMPAARLEGIGFIDAIDFIRDITGLSIVIDSAALKAAGVSEKTPVNLKVENVPVKAALEELAKQISKDDHKFAVGIVGRKVMITTAPGLQAAQKQYALAAAKGDPKHLGRMLPELNLNRIGLQDVIDFLRDVSGTDIFVEWQALEAAGIKRNTPITLRLRNTPLHEALRAVIDQAAAGAKQPLDFSVDQTNVIHIGPAAAVK